MRQPQMRSHRRVKQSGALNRPRTCGSVRPVKGSSRLYKRCVVLFWLVHALNILGDPVRRRILELLADGEQTSGAITEVIRAEFTLSQPAVSQHLRVLRENGFASVRAAGTRRFYAVDPKPLSEVDVWLDQFRSFWELRLDALSTELARSRRASRSRTGQPGAASVYKADPPTRGT